MKNTIDIKAHLIFEESVEKTFMSSLILGEIDCINTTDKIVYEFKCTKDLTVSHMIQLGLYMYLHGVSGYKYKLFNIFTNEIREITASPENLESMIRILVEHKLSSHVQKSDTEFLQEFSSG